MKVHVSVVCSAQIIRVSFNLLSNLKFSDDVVFLFFSAFILKNCLSICKAAPNFSPPWK